MESSEEQLLRGLRRGDGDAWRAWHRRHGASLLRVALRITGDRQDAEDAVQEAYLRLFRHLRSFRGSSSLRTWAYRIVVNTALQITRKTRRQTSAGTTPEEAVVVPDAGVSEAEAALAREVARLPDRQRAVFTLCAIEGLTGPAVARILELAPGTVRHHLHAARRTLAERLGPWLGSAAEGRSMEKSP